MALKITHRPVASRSRLPDKPGSAASPLNYFIRIASNTAAILLAPGLSRALVGAHLLTRAATRVIDKAEQISAELRHVQLRGRYNQLLAEATSLPAVYHQQLNELAPDLEKYEDSINLDALARDLDRVEFLIAEYRALGILPDSPGLATDAPERYQAAWTQAIETADKKTQRLIFRNHRIIAQRTDLEELLQRSSLPVSLQGCIDHADAMLSDLSHPLTDTAELNVAVEALSAIADAVKIYALSREDRLAAHPASRVFAADMRRAATALLKDPAQFWKSNAAALARETAATRNTLTHEAAAILGTPPIQDQTRGIAAELAPPDFAQVHAEFLARANRMFGVEGRSPGHASDAQVRRSHYAVTPEILAYLKKNFPFGIPRAAAEARLQLAMAEGEDLENRRNAATVYEFYLLQQAAKARGRDWQELLDTPDLGIRAAARAGLDRLPASPSYEADMLKPVSEILAERHDHLTRHQPMAELRALRYFEDQISASRDLIRDYSHTGQKKSAAEKILYQFSGGLTEYLLSHGKQFDPLRMDALLHDIRTARQEIHSGTLGRAGEIAHTIQEGEVLEKIQELSEEAIRSNMKRDLVREGVSFAAATVATAGVGTMLELTAASARLAQAAEATAGAAQMFNRWERARRISHSLGRTVGHAIVRQGTFLHSKAAVDQQFWGHQSLYDSSKGVGDNIFNLGVSILEFELMGQFHKVFKQMWTIKAPTAHKNVFRELLSNRRHWIHGLARDAVFFHAWSPLAGTLRTAAHRDIQPLKESVDSFFTEEGVLHTAMMTVAMGSGLGTPAAKKLSQEVLRMRVPEIRRVEVRQRKIATLDAQIKDLSTRKPSRATLNQIAELRNTQREIAETNAALLDAAAQRHPQSEALREQAKALHLAAGQYYHAQQHVEQLWSLSFLHDYEAELIHHFRITTDLGKRLELIEEMEDMVGQRIRTARDMFVDGRLDARSLKALESHAHRVELEHRILANTEKLDKLEHEIAMLSLNTPQESVMEMISTLLALYSVHRQLIVESRHSSPGRFPPEALSKVNAAMEALTQALGFPKTLRSALTHYQKRLGEIRKSLHLARDVQSHLTKETSLMESTRRTPKRRAALLTEARTLMQERHQMMRRYLQTCGADAETLESAQLQFKNELQQMEAAHADKAAIPAAIETLKRSEKQFALAREMLNTSAADHQLMAEAQLRSISSPRERSLLGQFWTTLLLAPLTVLTGIPTGGFGTRAKAAEPEFHIPGPLLESVGKFGSWKDGAGQALTGEALRRQIQSDPEEAALCIAAELVTLLEAIQQTGDPARHPSEITRIALILEALPRLPASVRMAEMPEDLPTLRAYVRMLHKHFPTETYRALAYIDKAAGTHFLQDAGIYRRPHEGVPIPTLTMPEIPTAPGAMSPVDVEYAQQTAVTPELVQQVQRQQQQQQAPAATWLEARVLDQPLAAQLDAILEINRRHAAWLKNAEPVLRQMYDGKISLSHLSQLQAEAATFMQIHGQLIRAVDPSIRPFASALRSSISQSQFGITSLPEIIEFGLVENPDTSSYLKPVTLLRSDPDVYPPGVSVHHFKHEGARNLIWWLENHGRLQASDNHGQFYWTLEGAKEGHVPHPVLFEAAWPPRPKEDPLLAAQLEFLGWKMDIETGPDGAKHVVIDTRPAAQRLIGELPGLPPLPLVTVKEHAELIPGFSIAVQGAKKLVADHIIPAAQRWAESLGTTGRRAQQSAAITAGHVNELDIDTIIRRPEQPGVFHVYADIDPTTGEIRRWVNRSDPKTAPRNTVAANIAVFSPHVITALGDIMARARRAGMRGNHRISGKMLREIRSVADKSGEDAVKWSQLISTSLTLAEVFEDRIVSVSVPDAPTGIQQKLQSLLGRLLS